MTEREAREASRAPTAAVARREEGRRLRELVPDGARLVALDRGGRPLASDALAAVVRGWLETSRPVAVVIGGSHGLPADLVAEAQLAWSLGPATLPHELARVVACEQLYRACTIVRGDPYHK
mgnify:CR=1 FL=1